MFLKLKGAPRTEVFADFFQKILEGLSSKGLNSSLIRKVANQEDEVIEAASSKGIQIHLEHDNRLPFLPVWPLSRMTLIDQLDLIKDPRGASDGVDNANKIEDCVVLNEQYFIFGVEVGRETEDLSSEETMSFFKDEGRSPLTVAETNSVAMFSDSLEDRDLLAMGSNYGNKSELLLLTTQSIFVPKKIVPIAFENLKQGVGKPSCVDRECFL